MKKLISTFLLMSTLALFMPLMPTTVSASPAQHSLGLYSDLNIFDTEDMEAVSEDLALCPRGLVRVRKHTARRTKVKHAIISGVAGAVAGGLLGGRKGVVIGAGAGAGGYLVYRYIKDRHGKCVLRRA